PDDCPKEGGVWSRTGAPCPKEGLVGTCHYPQTKQGEPGEYVNFYTNSKESISSAKKECLDQTGGGKPKEWYDAPAPPAASSAPPAASAGKPAAKPAAAGSAKPAATGSAKAKK